MCGRGSHRFQWKDIFEHLSAFVDALDAQAFGAPGPKPSYNAAPKSIIPVIRSHNGSLLPAMMQWWLVPSWSKESTIKYATFNARSEDAATKPTFRAPFRRRRCVIPFDGFYEWRKEDDGAKTPFYITRADGEIMYLAGLWDCWRDELESCTVLTTKPNAEMSALHNRMPCILEPERISEWTLPEEADPKAVAPLLVTPPDGLLIAHPVDRRVGNVRNNDPSLIEPV